MLVTTLRNPTVPFRNEVGGLIQDCLALVPTFEDFQFTYIRRDGNLVADAIAKEATHDSDGLEWDGILPANFRALVAQDGLAAS